MEVPKPDVAKLLHLTQLSRAGRTVAWPQRSMKKPIYHNNQSLESMKEK
jgi:hypothetical protein